RPVHDQAEHRTRSQAFVGAVSAGPHPAPYRFISANSVANTSIPSQRFRSLRFSFGACWLSSWLAIGSTMAGLPAGWWKRYLGMLPPSLGSRTGSRPIAD